MMSEQEIRKLLQIFARRLELADKEREYIVAAIKNFEGILRIIGDHEELFGNEN